jgi:hypothetical protein
VRRSAGVLTVQLGVAGEPGLGPATKQVTSALEEGLDEDEVDEEEEDEQDEGDEAEPQGEAAVPIEPKK